LIDQAAEYIRQDHAGRLFMIRKRACQAFGANNDRIYPPLKKRLSEKIMPFELKYDLVKKIISEQQARASAEREAQSRRGISGFSRARVAHAAQCHHRLAQIIAQGSMLKRLTARLELSFACRVQERIISDLYDAASISKGKFTVSLELLSLPKTVAEAVETVLLPQPLKKLYRTYSV
jgi:hypothetical protein